MAVNLETAKWAAKKSGTTQKMVARFEETEVNEQGGEIWGKKRMLNKVEEKLITENQMITLKERVGVLYEPGKLARLPYTFWVPVDGMAESKQQEQDIFEPEAGETGKPKR